MAQQVVGLGQRIKADPQMRAIRIKRQMHQILGEMAGLQPAENRVHRGATRKEHPSCPLQHQSLEAFKLPRRIKRSQDRHLFAGCLDHQPVWPQIRQQPACQQVRRGFHCDNFLRQHVQSGENRGDAGGLAQCIQIGKVEPGQPGQTRLRRHRNRDQRHPVLACHQRAQDSQRGFIRFDQDDPFGTAGQIGGQVAAEPGPDMQDRAKSGDRSGV